ncbi:hypothetical protein AAHC03_016592 [Spirometra sp. Aus1]|nr:unnamed protein product [Spirometra erinaceieuropaei]
MPGPESIVAAPKVGKKGAIVKRPNTYQLVPSPKYAFSAHRQAVRDLLQQFVQDILEDTVSATPDMALMSGLSKVKNEVLRMQCRFFPRHRIVVHGVIGDVGQNPPTLIYGSQCLASPECGDDCVSVSSKSSERFACVSVFGSYFD